jgi:hypothetical protein
VSGIKAAQFMMEKYPQAFMKDDCVPHVPVRYIYSLFKIELRLLFKLIDLELFSNKNI